MYDEISLCKHPGYVVYNAPYIVGYMTVYLQYIQHTHEKLHWVHTHTQVWKSLLGNHIILFFLTNFMNIIKISLSKISKGEFFAGF